MIITAKDIVTSDIFGEYPTTHGLNFGEGEAKPAIHSALQYADLLCGMLQAKMALEVAQNTERGYTGQWGNRDYYQDELETYYRSCERLYEFMRDEES